MVASSLTLTPPDAEWMRQARCAGYWDLMESAEEKDERAAKDLCQSCPVWEQCRAWTLSLPPRQDVAGVAGGLTEKQRDQARRRRRRSRPAAEPPKECTGCGEPKPADQFYLRPKHRGGRESRCSTCCSAQAQAHRAKKAAGVVTS
jgi:WhiB family redox-sensing transcriptional regulator